MTKKIEGLKLHSKDTGSSEIQIALLTDKIKILSIILLQSSKLTDF